MHRHGWTGRKASSGTRAIEPLLTDTRETDLAKLKAEMDEADRGDKHAPMIEARRRYETFVEACRRYSDVWDALTPQDRERVKVGLLPTGEPVITDARRAELRRRGLTR